jgi:hypothetical protein
MLYPLSYGRVRSRRPILQVPDRLRPVRDVAAGKVPCRSLCRRPPHACRPGSFCRRRRRPPSPTEQGRTPGATCVTRRLAGTRHALSFATDMHPHSLHSPDPSIDEMETSLARRSLQQAADFNVLPEHATERTPSMHASPGGAPWRVSIAAVERLATTPVEPLTWASSGGKRRVIAAAMSAHTDRDVIEYREVLTAGM